MLRPHKKRNLPSFEHIEPKLLYSLSIPSITCLGECAAGWVDRPWFADNHLIPQKDELWVSAEGLTHTMVLGRDCSSPDKSITFSS